MKPPASPLLGARSFVSKASGMSDVRFSLNRIRGMGNNVPREVIAMRKTRCGSESARAFLRGFACGIYPLSRSEIRRDIINSVQSASGLKDSFEAVGQSLHNAVGLMDAKVGR